MTEKELKFWNNLKDWYLNDIDICLVNEANYSAARTMLSFIDILGGFYRGLIKYKGSWYVRCGGNRGIGEKKKIEKINNIYYEKTEIKKQFLNFTKNYLPGFYKVRFQPKSVIAADVLYDNFRCGLVHEGHPKKGTGIFKENSSHVLRVDINKKIILLNITALRDLLRIAVFQYERDLRDANQKERMIRWRDRYKFLTKNKF